MKRDHYNCPLEATLDVIGGKWKLYPLWHLREETKRYGELKRSTRGITEKMLIQQLRELESDRLVKRKVYPEIPPKVEYSLTPYGKTFVPILQLLNSWGLDHIKKIGGVV
jgi:DNA-binding HxlR family transcriptional regulator